MHSGCAFLGLSSAGSAPAPLLSTEACFLSLAPMPSFPFTACFGRRGSEGKPLPTPRGTWCGGWVESPGSGAQRLTSLCQLHGPRQEESPPLGRRSGWRVRRRW